MVAVIDFGIGALEEFLFSLGILIFSIKQKIEYNYFAGCDNDNSKLQTASLADKLLELKNLLDDGTITLEEFEAKKSELLQ